jgi:hypothetical protein
MRRVSSEGNAPAGHGAHAVSRPLTVAFFATTASQIGGSLRAFNCG